MKLNVWMKQDIKIDHVLFFLHYCIYILCSHYKTFFKAIKILNWKKKKRKTFFLKELQHLIVMIIPSGKMKEGSI
jgi:hypothetical protein